MLRRAKLAVLTLVTGITRCVYREPHPVCRFKLGNIGDEGRRVGALTVR